MPPKSLRNRRKTKRGGKYVGKGAYGCTFVPPIRCRGEAERRPGMISKLMLPDGAVDEMKVKPLLEGVDPVRQFFLWPVETCDPEYELPENNITNICIN
jgi:hypothetical protein